MEPVTLGRCSEAGTVGCSALSWHFPLLFPTPSLCLLPILLQHLRAASIFDRAQYFQQRTASCSFDFTFGRMYFLDRLLVLVVFYLLPTAPDRLIYFSSLHGQFITFVHVPQTGRIAFVLVLAYLVMGYYLLAYNSGLRGVDCWCEFN
jgi:hypothetical protein